MKNNLLFSVATIAAMILSACGTAPLVVPTITSTNILPVPLTSTPNIPTPTENPLAGAPEGATGKDAKGNWIKVVATENGNTLTYTYDTERKSFYRPIINGVPLLDLRPDSNKIANIPDQMLMTVNIDQQILNEISLPVITHPQVSNDLEAHDFLWTISNDLHKALTKRGISVGPVYVEINAGNAFFTFTTKEGLQKWILGPNTKVIVNIRGDYDALNAGMANNGFSETTDYENYGPTNSFMVKYWTDQKGNLYCDIAPKLSADKWTKKQIVEMVLFAPINVMEDEDQTEPYSGRLLSSYILTWALNSAYPFFTFGPSN